MKKIIIKEEQLKLIENLILENKVQQLLSSVEAGDMILIFREGAKNPTKFEVIDKLQDGVFIRVADKNSEDRVNLIRFNTSDLNSNKLNLKFTRRPEGEKNTEKIMWKSMTIKGITNISVFDETKKPKGYAKIDDEGEEEVETSDEKGDNEDLNDDGESDKDSLYYKEALISLISDLDGMSKGVQYIFKLKDDSEIYLTVKDKDSKSIELSLDKTEGGGEAERYDELINYKLIFEPTISTVKPITGKQDSENSDEFRFDIDINRISNDGKDKGKEESITIKNIVDFYKAGPVSNLSDEEVLRTILSKPEVRSAFAKEPSLWDLITKKDPVGIFKAKDILNKVFSDNSDKNNLNNLFKMHQKVKFELMDNYFYKEVDGTKYTLNLGKKYSAKVSDKGSKGVLLKSGPLVIRLYRLKDKEENIYRGVVIIPQLNKEDITEKRSIKIYKQV